MSTRQLALGLGLALAAAACSTPSPQTTAAPPPAGMQAGEDGTVLTGSRLAKRGSDRTVKGVDNQSFRNDNRITSLGNEVGPRSQ